MFQVPTRTEVRNYLLWRQRDATRNSIQMVAQDLYPHKELQNQNTDQLQELIFQKGINWNDFKSELKRGRGIIKNENGWKMIEVPVFSQDPEFLLQYIPDNE